MTNDLPRSVHSVVGGNVDDARRFKLTLIAKCGLVFIPKHTMSEAKRLQLPECVDCHTELPHRLTIDPHIVYRCFDAAGRLIYVGCTVSPLQRMEQHKQNSWWFPQVAAIRNVVFPNKDYALFKERQAIGNENPRWNVRGRDRSLWAVDDYADMHYALQQTGAAERRLVKVKAEAQLRFGVDLDDIEVAA